MKNAYLVLAALLFFCAVSVRADEVIVLERKARDFDRWSTTHYGRDRVLSAISRETGVPKATLAEQRNRTGLGYGGLFIANSLASETGRTFDEIAAQKAGGHGWGWIAKQNNVKLGPIVSRAHHVDKAVKNDLKNKKVKKTKKNKKEKLYADANRSRHNHRSDHWHNTSLSSHGNFHAHGHGKGH